MLNELYDKIIQDNPGQSLTAHHDVNEEMLRRECVFDGKPLPYFLKPYFLNPAQLEVLSSLSELFIGLLEKITHLYFERPELRAMFSLTQDAADLIEIDPGYSRHIVISRPDAFLWGEKVRFIEFNCDSPAGAVYTDLEEDIMLSAYPLRKAAEQVEWLRLSRKEAVLNALIASYREFGGKREKPIIAIVDWRDVKTVHEFELFQDYLATQGYDSVVADPRDMRIKNGELIAGGKRIDIIYRRVIFRELLERLDEVGDFIRAYRDKKVCVVNPLRSRLAANKSMLAVMTNPAYDHLFTEEEIAAKEHAIPWTRRLVDAEKFYGGRKRYLRDHIVDHQRTMVLKPADGYGGRDVHIGRETEPDDWQALTQKALHDKEDWVVQEFVPIPKMTVPVVADGQVDLVEKKVNLNPYVFDGKYAGAIARLSDHSVINVSAGGGLVPALGYRERPAA